MSPARLEPRPLDLESSAQTMKSIKNHSYLRYLLQTLLYADEHIDKISWLLLDLIAIKLNSESPA